MTEKEKNDSVKDVKANGIPIEKVEEKEVSTEEIVSMLNDIASSLVITDQEKLRLDEIVESVASLEGRSEGLLKDTSYGSTSFKVRKKVDLINDKIKDLVREKETISEKGNMALLEGMRSIFSAIPKEFLFDTLPFLGKSEDYYHLSERLQEKTVARLRIPFSSKA